MQMTRMRAATSAIALAMTGLVAISVAARAEMVNGEIRKIDTPAKKITLRHDPIKSLDMDSMTMVFRVADMAMLKGFKAGDRIRFEAGRVDGALTVTRIEKRR